MSLNVDLLDDAIVSQVKSVFQTVISVNDTKIKTSEASQFSKLNAPVFKYDILIENRNVKKGKVYPYVSA